jgi:hypothetical protein
MRVCFTNLLLAFRTLDLVRRNYILLNCDVLVAALITRAIVTTQLLARGGRIVVARETLIYEALFVALRLWCRFTKGS